MILLQANYFASINILKIFISHRETFVNTRIVSNTHYSNHNTIISHTIYYFHCFLSPLTLHVPFSSLLKSNNNNISLSANSNVLFKQAIKLFQCGT